MFWIVYQLVDSLVELAEPIDRRLFANKWCHVVIIEKALLFLFAESPGNELLPGLSAMFLAEKVLCVEVNFFEKLFQFETVIQ